MKKHSLLKKAFAVSGLLLGSVSVAVAQEYHNTTERIGGIWASGMSLVTIGPGADITVDGDWYLTANTVTIDPAAKIGGTGTIHLMTPATYGAAGAPTALNAGGILGSGTGIGCKLSIENGNTVVLGGNNDLVMSNSLNFAKVGAHLLIGARNVVFTGATTAAATSGTVPAVGFLNQPADAAATFQDAYIVTNGTGVVTKRALANGSSFTYAIGQSASNGANTDYTPATVTNTAAATRDLSTQVKSYANSGSLEGNVAYGVDRTWQITGSTAGTATVALTNNAGSEGTSYVRNAAFVTQQVNNGVWDVVAGGPPTTPNYTHTRTGLNVPTSGLTSYFSKSSDNTISISQNATLDLVVGLYGDMQSSGVMRNDLQAYFSPTVGLLPTTDPYGLGATYANINDPSGPAGTVVDWVKVEVRSAANPSTLLQTRALLLKPNGHIVDIDGTTPLFNGQAIAARGAVYQRNHLAILSNSIPTGVFRGRKAYDFTTSLAQASAQPGDPAQMIVRFGKWCMWAGDVNQDLGIDGTDFGTVSAATAAGPFDVYNVNDLNLDGGVDGTDFGIMNFSNNTAPYSTLVNY